MNFPVNGFPYFLCVQYSCETSGIALFLIFYRLLLHTSRPQNTSVTLPLNVISVTLSLCNHHRITFTLNAYLGVPCTPTFTRTDLTACEWKNLLAYTINCWKEQFERDRWTLVVIFAFVSFFSRPPPRPALFLCVEQFPMWLIIQENRGPQQRERHHHIKIYSWWWCRWTCIGVPQTKPFAIQCC